jgi:ABC-type nitrate/sulfonate/bicarbonate transport system substrate-binding protein
MKKLFTAYTLLIFVLMALTGCTSTAPPKKEEPAPVPAPPPLTKVTVMLDWTPNTNHTGLYVAKEKGFYNEQGLDVEILQSGEPGPAQLVAAGKVDFGVSYQEEVTNARAADIPIVSLAAVIQHNTSGFASLKEANLTRPKDLEGKRYGGWGSPVEHAVIEAVMAKDGGNGKKVKFIDIGSADFFSVIGKKVDFTWIYYGWDGIQAELRKIPLNVIMLKDFDKALDYYTPVIITSEKNIKERADLVKKFMHATSKGYELAIAQPEEGAKILLKHAPELNAELVMASQKWLSTQLQADAPQWGRQKKEVWEGYAQWMFERKLLDKMIEADKAFTNEFLPPK